MKIICPYTQLHDATVDALSEHAAGHDVRYVHVGDHDEQLFEVWQDVWAAREDVIWVEHDIKIHAGVIPGFEACEFPWCAFAYPYPYGNSNPYFGTGCARFRGELMAAFPDMIDRVGERFGPHHPPRHWCSIDGFQQLELAGRGYLQHHHHPPVAHLDASNSHGCLGTF